MTGTTKNYLSFRIGSEWYGVNLDYITEVLHLVGLTELPGSPPEVLGLLTLRESVMPVIDLRRKFNLPDTTLALSTPIIAMRIPAGIMAIVVDDVDDVEEIGEVMTYAGAETPYVAGVVKQNDRLLLLLDVVKIHHETQAHHLHEKLDTETEGLTAVAGTQPAVAGA